MVGGGGGDSKQNGNGGKSNFTLQKKQRDGVEHVLAMHTGGGGGGWRHKKFRAGFNAGHLTFSCSMGGGGRK